MSNTEIPLEPVHKDHILGTERISKLIIRFSIPAIISGIVNATYNIVDQIFIGQGIGEYGMAATNVAFPFVTVGAALAMLLGVGGASNFNLNLGRRNIEEASKTVGNALSLMMISGLCLAAFAMTFLKPLLFVFGATELIMPYAQPYAIITNLGIPFAIFSIGATHIIRADGSPNFSMAVMLSGAIFNLIFDPVFLFVFNLGIEGIALATSLGQMISSGVALYYLIKKFKSVPLKKKHFKLSFPMTKSICALGSAMFFNSIAMTLVQIIKSNVLRDYGALSVYGREIPLAAVGVVSKVNTIYFAFLTGIYQGCQPIHSYNYGAGNYARVKETYKRSLVYATVVAVAFFLVFQFLSRPIVSIFGSNSELFYEFAARYLRIFTLASFINAIQPMTSGFFTSIGKAKKGFWISLTRQILLLSPLMLILPRFMGVDGVMWSGPIADMLTFVIVSLLAKHEMKHIDGLIDEQNGLLAESSLACGKSNRCS